ncbi:MAG: cyclic pyranopterin monophosphate synthase MoaC [Opitutales bacterium]|nr:cyclic pyranopterin monophosphate synthase MoaC [Opitutales bacterium]MCH8540518.1 cyclic pyranopterin monophosphate synthase MoaC [Opitutales bacterium]
MSDQKFSHLNESGDPRMVDVSGKAVTVRTATASGMVTLGEAILTQLQDGDLPTRKGAVFQTAILAGTMAAKDTARFIPLCHTLPLEDCRISVTPRPPDRVEIQATVRCTGKTGVEMEALTAVSVAALTIYDMTKALSHDIEIGPIRLLEKTGGKSTYRASS